MEKYEVIKTIGVGGEGTVLLVRERSERNEEDIWVLKKRLCFTLAEANEGLQEAMTLARFHHEHVVHYHDVFMETEVHKEMQETVFYLCLVMSYAEGGDLLQHLSSAHDSAEDDIKKWMRQLCSGVQAIHKLGLIHRDLKLENIFLDRHGNVVIGDFGVVEKRKAIARTASFRCGPGTEAPGEVALFEGMKGTYQYLAPEVLNRSEEYDQRIDVWALGCIFYEMLTRAFLAETRRCPAEDLIANPSYISELLSPIASASARQLVQGMLEMDWKIRPTIEIVLSHPYLSMGEHHRSMTLSAQQRSMTLSEADIQLPSLPASVANGVVRSLSHVHLDRMAEVITGAYAPIETSEYFLLSKQLKKRTHALSRLSKKICKFWLDLHQCFGFFIDKKLIAVALWVAPGKELTLTSGRRYMKPARDAVICRVPARKMIMFARARALMFHRFKKHFGKGQFWRLLHLAVDPEYQRMGVGSHLLHHTIAEAESDDLPVWASCNNADSVRFFMQNGFRIVEKVKQSSTGWEYMTLRHDPGQQRLLEVTEALEHCETVVDDCTTIPTSELGELTEMDEDEISFDDSDAADQ